MKKTKVRGSYTVEAAFILPTVLFIIIGLIYLGFYLHDKNKIQLLINDSLYKARNYVVKEIDIYTGKINYTKLNNRSILYLLENDFAEKEAIIYNFVSEELKGGLFIANPESIIINLTSSNIDIQVSTTMEFPFVGIKKLFTSSGINITQVNKTEIYNTTEFIRLFNVFTGVIDKVEIINDTLSKLKNILNGDRGGL